MLMPMIVLYLIIKGAFLAGLIKAFTSSDDLGRRPIMMALIYTAGVALLSFVYFNPEMMASMGMPWKDRVINGVEVDGRMFWLGTSFLLSALYFWLLHKFENAGLLWWSILLIGTGLVIW